MAVGPRLDLRQTQSLVMTPQLQQAIRLLALSNLEVETFIAEELEKNPLLEATGLETPAPDDTPGGDGASAEPAAAEPSDEPAFAEREYDADTLYQGGPGLDGGLAVGGGSGGGTDGEMSGIEATLAGGLSLADHLMAQAGATLAGRDLAMAARIIDLIDDAGYFTGVTADLAERLGASLADVERVLGVIQTFDPTGVGARALAECLALQAKEADRYDPAMERLLAHLDLLARGALPRLRRLCGVSSEDLADMIREVRGYDPKPGLRYGGERIPAVTPDLFVARTANGWAIELNTATLPRVLVNQTYYVELSAAGDKESRAWLSECLANATWLVKALDQRARTIVKVATEIVRQQEPFFLHGVAHLKPLTLKAVADAIGMHESTVSRVTSNKYLSCGRGLFELKYFFTSAIHASDGGEAVSAEAVKSHIARLIAQEGDHILSDDKLVDLLNAAGFDIARRTVAKYREAIGLGSSVQRRRQRLLGADAP
ncbi:MAG TPA: RNA polymerase factor sigma-54 [Sphingomonadaceae bacterium]|nr:RNA polymerase factor sigma-54 [Sphingomonadaceae bacterium]